MKIQYMSDLHLEFGELYLPEPAADILVLAGDIFTVHGVANVDSKKGRYTKFFDHVSANWKHVILVAGNHEYYKWTKSNVIAYIQTWIMRWPNIHFLENNRFEYEGVLFAGATMWTDFFGGQDKYKNYVQAGMNDYRVTYLTTNMTENYHNTTKQYFDRLDHDKIAIVTHHAPSALSSHPRFAGDPLNAGYYSNMDEWIAERPKFKIWIHGHMHNSSDYMIGSTRILNNARGYPGEANTGFDPVKTVDIV